MALAASIGTATSRVATAIIREDRARFLILPTACRLATVTRYSA
jgi:hypothetical protein